MKKLMFLYNDLFFHDVIHNYDNLLVMNKCKSYNEIIFFGYSELGINYIYRMQCFYVMNLDTSIQLQYTKQKGRYANIIQKKYLSTIYIFISSSMKWLRD